MARIVITATEDANGNPSFGSASGASAPSSAAFEAALATLVADGATPTQAHVTAVNNAYTTYKAALTAYLASGVNADVVLSVNAANVTTKNQVLVAVRAMLSRILNGTNAFS